MKYRIVNVKGHYEVYIDGRFYCSADNTIEAAKEIEEYEKRCMVR